VPGGSYPPAGGIPRLAANRAESPSQSCVNVGVGPPPRVPPPSLARLGPSGRNTARPPRIPQRPLGLGSDGYRALARTPAQARASSTASKQPAQPALPAAHHQQVPSIIKNRAPAAGKPASVLGRSSLKVVRVAKAVSRRKPVCSPASRPQAAWVGSAPSPAPPGVGWPRNATLRLRPLARPRVRRPAPVERLPRRIRGRVKMASAGPAAGIVPPGEMSPASPPAGDESRMFGGPLMPESVSPTPVKGVPPPLPGLRTVQRKEGAGQTATCVWGGKINGWAAEQPAAGGCLPDPLPPGTPLPQRSRPKSFARPPGQSCRPSLVIPFGARWPDDQCDRRTTSSSPVKPESPGLPPHLGNRQTWSEVHWRRKIRRTCKAPNQLWTDSGGIPRAAPK